MPPRPPHPIPTFGDDGQRPFLRGQDGMSLSGDLPFGKNEILPDGLICRRCGCYSASGGRGIPVRSRAKGGALQLQS